MIGGDVVERGQQWRRTSDALGRLTQVVEPGSLRTNYSNDALNNLLSVNQLGGVGDTSRTRTFSYDSLSRLLCASNPETSTAACPSPYSGSYTSGTTGYTYDANGNVVTKTSPAVNAASGTQTIGYCYDALNRPTYKFYSGSFSCTSPSGFAASYSYDSSGISGAQNVMGRLTDEKSYAGATLASERQPYAYDPMGRLLKENQCLFGNCSASVFHPAYTYDRAGNLLTLTDGTTPNPTSSGGMLTLTNSYDGGGRLQTVTSNWVDGTHPATLFATQSGQSPPCGSSATGPYAAFGGLMNATFGSASYGSGIALNRTYDNRLRMGCEIDTGEAVSTPTSGTATVTITGAEQVH